MTHQTFGALSPAFSGTNQERGFTISGNRLTLRPPTSANGDQRTLTWERVPDLPNLTPTHRKLIGFWKLISLERRNAKGDLLSSNPGHDGIHRLHRVGTRDGAHDAAVPPAERGPVADARKRRWRRTGVTRAISGRTPSTSPKSSSSTTSPPQFNSGPVGTDFQRFFEFSGKRLILKPPVTKDSNGEDVQMTITWERLSD